MEYRKFSTFIDSVQYGYTADETSLTEGDAKYLRITDIVPYFVDKERVPFCKINSKNKDKYKVYENDLLIARTGATTGFNLIVPKGFDNYVFASYLIRFNYNQETLYPQYLKHVLKSQQYYGFVKNYIGGSAQPGMNPKGFSRFEIPYVEYNIQKRIASILSAYDDLIENNNKRIKILEKMAENLYKEWFVRFRFPGYEKIEFENGVPKGWTVKHIGDICKIITGKKDANDATGDGEYPFFTCARETNVYTNEYFLDTKAILISGNGSYTGFVKKHAGKFDLYQRTYALYDFQNIGWLYVYWFMKIGFEREFMGGARGSAIPYITKPNIEKFKILIPAKRELELAEAFFASIHDECLYLERANRNLTKQRDMLLPRLMSGKLEV